MSDFKIKSKNQKGFALIEIFLSLALLIILVGIGLPVSRHFYVKNTLNILTQNVAHYLRRAQIFSQVMSHDATWGIYLSDNELTFFKGADYASRDTDFDEFVSVSPEITISGIREVVFDKLTGLPQTTGTITLTSSTNDTKEITINAHGILSY